MTKKTRIVERKTEEAKEAKNKIFRVMMMK